MAHDLPEGLCDAAFTTLRRVASLLCVILFRTQLMWNHKKDLFGHLPGTWKHISNTHDFLSNGMLVTLFATALLLNRGFLKSVGCLEYLLCFDEKTGGWDF